jgi:eukaryotic-like serine/threonine-protein kinase
MAEAFGPYLLLGEIARGGMAEVQWAVPADGSEGLFALKRILRHFVSDPTYVRYFDSEITLTQALHHPRVVKTMGSGTANGLRYLALEYVHGRALSRILHWLRNEGKRLPVPHAVYLAVCTLEGLDYLHNARDPSGNPLRLVLCDLSLSNVLLSYSGEVKLIDFGIASSTAGFYGQIGASRGKKSYMSPEQLRGLALDPRTDVYAMGICFYELLSGAMSFDGLSEFEIEERTRTGNLPFLTSPPAGVSAPLFAVVAKAVSYKPEDRFQSAAEFADALRPYAKLGKGRPVGNDDLRNVLSVLLKSQVAEDEARMQAVLAGRTNAAAQAEVETPRVPMTLPDSSQQ